MGSSTEPPDWKAKRKRTMIVFGITSIVLGMESGMTIATLWLYLTTLIRPAHPEVFYALILSAYPLTSVIFSAVVGRFVDRTRHVRVAFAFCFSCEIVGNILYSLPFSPHFLLFGRAISGFGDTFRGIIVGEVARCYTTEEAFSYYSLFGFAFHIGFISGSALNFVFLNLSFSIGAWHITYANIPGIYMSLAFIVLGVIAHLFVSDLSKMYDLKEENYKAVYSTDDFDEGRDVYLPKQEHSVGSALKYLCSSVDVAVVMVSTFVTVFYAIVVDVWIPLIVVEIQHWGEREISAILIVSSLSTVILLLIFWKYPMLQKYSFSTALLSQFFTIGVLIIDFTMGAIALSHAAKIIDWAIYSILYGASLLIEDVFLIPALTPLVPSSMQSFAEGLRKSIEGVAFIAATLLGPIIFRWMWQASVGIALANFLILVVLICRRKTLGWAGLQTFEVEAI